MIFDIIGMNYIKVGVVVRDYYEILGVSKSASGGEIKSAYRNMAKKYHPDLNQGDEEAQEMFKEVSEAYEVLSDDEKRGMYDRFGHAGVNGQGGGGYSQGFDMGDIFGDLFGDIFGGGFGSSTRTKGPTRGADLRYDLKIDFMEAVFGIEKEISVTKDETCSRCDGSGAEPETQKHTCGNCSGTGEVQYTQQSPFGQMVRVAACDECNGTGEIIDSPCTSCKGTGSERVTKKLKIKIPAGVDTGSRIVLRNEGGLGEKGGPKGDLYIYISVREHELYQRHGNDIHYELPISFVDATLGGEIEIALLDRMSTYDIPEGTKPGKTFKVKGEGVKSTRGNFKGDLYFTVTIDIPQILNEEQKEALLTFSNSINEEHKDAKKKGFFEKLKSSFTN